MNAPRPLRLILTFCCLCLPAAILSGRVPEALPAEAPAAFDEAAFFPEDVNLPAGIQELIRASRTKYLEGSDRIKSGDAEGARESFNKAVDMLLQSNWDLASTPTLNRFFQDLIRRIKDDESEYLLVPGEPEDETESAVVDELEELDLIPISYDPTLQDQLALELLNGKYEIPITINEMVMKSLNYWLNGGRSHFEAGLLRSGQYRPIIERIFREESVPLDLMYLAQVESMFKTNAVSRARAKGIWQFGRATAVRYGLKVTRDVDERSDPEKSTRAAARYLNDLFAMFQDWNLALAAYNWGEGKVQRLVKSTGISDFWELIDLKRKIPKETRNHVPLVQASVILGRNPEKYGLPTELHPPLQYTEVSVSKPVDLRAVAKILDISIDDLKKLNPALRGITTPANYPDYQLKIPVGADPGIEEQLAALPRAKARILPEFEGRHKIQRGECLSTIAARYRVSVADLARANNISVKKTLIAGTWLQVPSRSSAAKKKAGAKGAEEAAAKKRNSSRVSSAKDGASGSGDVPPKDRPGGNTATKQIASAN
jgi:membrane-bound lytic murein transglycosylase D